MRNTTTFSRAKSLMPFVKNSKKMFQNTGALLGQPHAELAELPFFADRAPHFVRLTLLRRRAKGSQIFFVGCWGGSSGGGDSLSGISHGLHELHRLNTDFFVGLRGDGVGHDTDLDRFSEFLMLIVENTDLEPHWCLFLILLLVWKQQRR